MSKPQSFRDVIELFDSMQECADAMKVDFNHVGIMKYRDSIPARYWHSLVKYADRKGMPIDGDMLIKIAAEGRKG